MVLRHIAKMGAALLVAGALAIGAAPPASAHKSSTSGNRSLASVLAKDGSGFDRNWNDFDIVDNAVSAVLKAKPNSAVKVLADGKTPVTAFLPTDRAFRLLVKDLTGTSCRSEKKVFTTVASPRDRHRRGRSALPRRAGGDDHLQAGAASQRCGPDDGIGWHGDRQGRGRACS